MGVLKTTKIKYKKVKFKYPLLVQQGKKGLPEALANQLIRGGLATEIIEKRGR
ncbi:hypothetical protein GWN26_06245, partial [Candidatus Saccharibacteria bacterium]|nr:hypothetical protein [Candidatus Saccharibacteria bacterium]NIV03460.1 hypothetical protein [Calditrichia bacterium]NIV71966.1 hypothetical protein [Calditrichia bacterium]NIV98756.1 hypothetical protein [Candidatus Saccharibacteria bacterium]NIW78619.1 hypothetical protein [Calditrichia bacterium]